MIRRLSTLNRCLSKTAPLTLALILLAVPCFAQSSVTLDKAVSEVTDTTIRAGSYSDTNFEGDVLMTRASDNAEYLRRALLKFDTQNTIPAGASVVSARLTLTVKEGGADGSRRIGVYYVTHAFQTPEATWEVRKTGLRWDSKGGDLGDRYAVFTAPNTPKAKVTVDVTDLVQAAVDGTLDASRYARLALVDVDASTSDSYREYYASETSDASLRPRLVVTWGSGSSSSSITAPPSSTSGTIRVLHWNTHHGVGTDGAYNLDRLATWIAKMKPDLISLNEVERFTGYGNEDQPAKYAALLKKKTGQTWHYTFVSRDGGSKGQGNLILSRLPLTGSGSKRLSNNRAVPMATVTVNGQNVSMFSAHLDADSSSRRATQIRELTSWAKGIRQQRIIAGDFNAWPGAGEIGGMTGPYEDAWAEAVSMGSAASFSGNDGDTRKSRIDYVFASREAGRLALKKAQVYDTRGSGGVMPSDHRPLVAVYEVR